MRALGLTPLHVPKELLGLGELACGHCGHIDDASEDSMYCAAHFRLHALE